MSALAAATGSVNLGQGFPDTDGPREIAQAAAAAILGGRGNQYPPGPGVPELRQAIAEHQQRFYGLGFDPDTEVLVTAGATEAVAASLLALVEPGDEVIAFEPYYDSYAACVAMAGGVRVPVTLRPPGFRPDLDALRAAITPRTRLILLNSPHNPTGSVFTRAELAVIAGLARERDLLVLADEVYEHMVYTGEHVPIGSLPGMRERTVSISSAGKTFSFCAAGATCSAPGCRRSASWCTRRMAPISSLPTSGSSATPTAWSSAGRCRTRPEWSRFPAPCCMTIPMPGGPRCGSRSASGPRSCRTRSPGWGNGPTALEGDGRV